MSAPRPGRGGRLYAITLTLLFAAALFAHLRLAGTSPVAFDDTFNDESEVRLCVHDDSCTLVGMQTSVPGLYHAVGWLELRTLLARLGGDVGDAHILVQILNALAVVLVFHLATHLAGPLAGAAAVWIFMDRIEAVIRVAVLYNSSPLLFLGAVLLLACTAFAYRPGIAALSLAALVGAVLANVHLACALSGASLAWLALSAPRRRLWYTAFAVALFAAASFALAPPGWLHNLQSVLRQRGATGHTVIPAAAASNALLDWALFALAAWAAAFALRAPRWALYRRHLGGAIALIAPFLAAFLAAPRLGFFAEPKYLIHLKAAVAVAAAVPLATLASALLRAISPRLLTLAERALPLALALLLVSPLRLHAPAEAGSVAAEERAPTFADLAATARLLRQDYGWDVMQIVAQLKTPHSMAGLTGLRQLAADLPARRDPVAVDSSPLLLVLDSAALPEPPPPHWHVLRRGAHSVAALVLLRSRLDWRDFEICARAQDDPHERCERGGWHFDATRGVWVPNMPPGVAGWRGTLRLTFALRDSRPSFASAIFMPRLPLVCGGRITSLAAAGAELDADGRRAALPADATGSVELQWRVGEPECDPLAYNALPPFFVEGDAEGVRQVEALLRRGER